jgi:hypothetical protein
VTLINFRVFSSRAERLIIPHFYFCFHKSRRPDNGQATSIVSISNPRATFAGHRLWDSFSRGWPSNLVRTVYSAAVPCGSQISIHIIEGRLMSNGRDQNRLLRKFRIQTDIDHVTPCVMQVCIQPITAAFPLNPFHVQ